MKAKIVLSILLTILMASSIYLHNAQATSYSNESELDFFWGYRYTDTIVNAQADLSTLATSIIKKALGTDYSMSAYIRFGITYDFQLGLHSPYEASLYLSDTNPRVKQGTSGHITITPKSIYFSLNVTSTLSLKVGATLYWKGIQVGNWEYPWNVPFSFTQNIDTEYLSPLGTYRVFVGELIKNKIGNIMPKFEVILGFVAGAVIAIPLDWDFALVFNSYIDASADTGSELLLTPSSMTFTESKPQSFEITPQSGGSHSVTWGFSQRMNIGIEFYVKSRITADIAAGAAATYESPWYSSKVFSSSLINFPIKTSPSSISIQLSIPQPKLVITLDKVDSKIQDTTLRFLVTDEAEDNVIGATVNIKIGTKSFSANDIGDGRYSVVIPSSELSPSILEVSASKTGYQDALVSLNMGPEYLNEYSQLQSEYNKLTSSAGAVPLSGIQVLDVILIGTTTIFAFSTVYLLLKRKRRP